MPFGDPATAASAEELLHRNRHKTVFSGISEDYLPNGTEKGCIVSTIGNDMDIDALIARYAGEAEGPGLQMLPLVDNFLGTLEDIFMIQHTDCGSLHVTEDSVQGHLRDRHLCDDEQIDKLVFGVGNTLEQRVRDNVKLIKGSTSVLDELKAHTKGLIYDINTGVLTDVLQSICLPQSTA